MGYVVSTNNYNTISLNENDKIKSILQNISIILRTKKGTCPMYRRFGVSDRYLDMPEIAAPPVIYAELKEAIEEYEPRVQVINVEFSRDHDVPGVLIPTVEVIINET